jgi:hypothetical protein
MAGKDRGMELPHRIRSAARAGPLSPAAPVLSPELRHHMQAAVTAERAKAVAREQERAAGHHAAGPVRRVLLSGSAPGKGAGPETSSPVGGPGRKRTGAASAGPERIIGPIPGDDVTGWFGAAVKPRPAAGPEPAVKAGTVVEPEPAVRAQPGRPRRRAGASLVALGLAIIVIASLAAAAVKHFSRPPTAQAAVRAQAAAWVAGQVSPEVTVSCDAVMCAALKAHGFPAGKLVMLASTSPDPVPSDLVVETSAVRAQFGNSLAITWAPAVLASFGSGTGVITVRVVAPHDAAAYQASLEADLADRKRSGTALLNHSRITVSATARSQLAAGQVDSRLLLALASLAGHQPIDIVRFENPGPGASPGVPLRFADLAESIPPAHMDTAAYMRAALAVLSTTAARIGPARVVSGTLQGQPALQIQFTAPSPLETTGLGSGWFRRGAGGGVASRPGLADGAAGDGGDPVCHETADLAERDRDGAAARAFETIAAVTDR